MKSLCTTLLVTALASSHAFAFDNPLNNPRIKEAAAAAQDESEIALLRAKVIVGYIIKYDLEKNQYVAQAAGTPSVGTVEQKSVVLGLGTAAAEAAIFAFAFKKVTAAKRALPIAEMKAYYKALRVAGNERAAVVTLIRNHAYQDVSEVTGRLAAADAEMQTLAAKSAFRGTRILRNLGTAGQLGLIALGIAEVGNTAIQITLNQDGNIEESLKNVDKFIADSEAALDAYDSQKEAQQ